MAPPSFLNTDFAFTQLLGVVDVADIVTAVRTMLTATLPVASRWTEAPANVFKTAPDLAGRFMKVTVAKTAATRLQFKIEDPSGVIRDGEIDIAAGGSTVNVFGGTFHLFIEANNAGTWEPARAFMSDPTPEALGAHTNFVFCATMRDSGGFLIGNNAEKPNFWQYRDTTGVIHTVPNQFCGVYPAVSGNPTQNHLLTEAGSDVAVAAGLASTDAGANGFSAGKMFQAVWVSQDSAPGSILAIPIDTGVTGNFQVTNMVLPEVGGSLCRLAIRRP